MIRTCMTSRALVVATLAGAATFAFIALGYPSQISSPVLGAGWRCRASVFVTSCTHVGRLGQIHGTRQEAIDMLRV